jgi:HSP20 family protein
MSFWDIEPEDWFRRFFSSGGSGGGGPLSRRGGGGWFGNEMPRQIDEMRREMERMFEEQFKEIQTKAPKELVREYETPEGVKVREIGPLVYGYSTTIGPDGKPNVREFGNVGSLGGIRIGGSTSIPQISAEREALADVTTTDKEVKVVLEMPGIDKQSIKINAYDNAVEIIANDPKRKYHRKLDLPPEADISTARSTYKNGILEIAFDKKKETKPKGKDVKVE